MLSVYSTPEKFEKQQPPAILDLCLRKTRAGKSRDYCDVTILEKLCTKTKAPLQLPVSSTVDAIFATLRKVFNYQQDFLH